MSNLFPMRHAVGRVDRIRLKGHRPGIVWFTGLSGAGKTTLADRTDGQLNRAGVHTAALDGDNIRTGLNRDLGFDATDRDENIRRVAEVARLMADAGLVALCSFISPFRRERTLARAAAGDNVFLEVFVDTPLATCIARDPKGLYRRALAGEIRGFTGIDQPYEAPEAPDLVVGRDGETIERSVERVAGLLLQHGLVGARSA